MKTAAKVLLFLGIILAHKTFTSPDTQNTKLNEVVQKVNQSISTWVPQPSRS